MSILYIDKKSHVNALAALIPGIEDSRASLGEVVSWTGRDTTKIDFAIPQGWADNEREQGRDPRNTVWTYESGGIFGEPLTLKECQKDIVKVCKEHVAKWNDMDLGKLETYADEQFEWLLVRFQALPKADITEVLMAVSQEKIDLFLKFCINPEEYV